jgi:ribonuclease P protein subunit RPR2
MRAIGIAIKDQLSPKNKSKYQHIKQNNPTRNTRSRRGRMGRRTKEMVGIAKERIRILLSLAEREILRNKNYTRAQRYVILARNIGMRYNVRMEKYFRNKICRACNSYLISSATSHVRCQGGKVITQCKICGNITRIPLHKPVSRP